MVDVVVVAAAAATAAAVVCCFVFALCYLPTDIYYTHTKYGLINTRISALLHFKLFSCSMCSGFLVFSFFFSFLIV